MNVVRGAGQLLLVTTVLASLTACGQASETKSSDGTAVPSTSATTSIAASPTGSPASSNELGLTIHMIPESWADATGITVASDGTEVVWSAINALDPRGQPYMADVVSFVPGRDAEPRIIYRHPDRDSLILNVAVRHGHYGFLEGNVRLGPGWRLWALPGPNKPAVLLDKDDAPDGMPTPLMPLTDDRLIWTAIHPRQGVLTYELHSARFDGSDPRVLLSSPLDKLQYWMPSTSPDGRYVLYATVEPVESGYRYRIFSLDLTRPGATPVRLGTSDEATQPETNGTNLIWRVVWSNVANWGQGLVSADPTGSNPRYLSLPAPHIIHATVGRRFVAYDTFEPVDNLTLSDLKTDKVVTVEQWPKADGVGYQQGWTIVAGDLLIFRRISTVKDVTKSPEVCWAILPSP